MFYKFYKKKVSLPNAISFHPTV